MPAEWDGIICISAGISNSHNTVEQANIEAQFEARVGFPFFFFFFSLVLSSIMAAEL